MTTATDSATLEWIISALRYREKEGLVTYGTTVDRTDLSHLEWLTNALEEDMDRCLYMKRAIDTAIALIAERDRLREALRFAVDNPDFDSLVFDTMARKALQESVA